MKHIKYLMFLCSLFAVQHAFSQSIKITSNKSIIITKKFKTVYSGPRKEGGLLINMYNRKNDEYLFIYQGNDSAFQSIIFYFWNSADYNKMYTALKTEFKTDSLKVSKLGRTLYENGKKYYQLEITK